MGGALPAPIEERLRAGSMRVLNVHSEHVEILDYLSVHCIHNARHNHPLIVSELIIVKEMLRQLLIL